MQLNSSLNQRYSSMWCKHSQSKTHYVQCRQKSQVRNIVPCVKSETVSSSIDSISLDNPVAQLKENVVERVKNFSVPEDIKPHLVMIASQSVFGLWYIIGHQVLSQENGSDPLSFAFFRELLATAGLFAISRKFEGEQKIESQTDLYWILVVGLFAFGNIGGFLLALSILPQFTTACSQPAVPVVCLLISVALGKEKLTKNSALGVALSVAGALLVTAGSQSGAEVALPGEGDPTIGYVSLMVSVCCYACMYIFMGKIADKYPPFTTTAWYYSVSSVLTFVAVLSQMHFSFPELFDQAQILLDPSIFAGLLYASFFATIFTYGSATYCSKYLSPSTLSLYNTLQPMAVAAISMGFFHESITPMESLGCAAIVGGLFATQAKSLFGGSQSGAADAVADADQQEDVIKMASEGIQSRMPKVRGIRFFFRSMKDIDRRQEARRLEAKASLEGKPQPFKYIFSLLLLQMVRVDANLLSYLFTLFGVKGNRMLTHKQPSSQLKDFNQQWLDKVLRDHANSKRGSWAAVSNRVMSIIKRRG